MEAMNFTSRMQSLLSLAQQFQQIFPGSPKLRQPKINFKSHGKKWRSIYSNFSQFQKIFTKFPRIN
jgi:hypothetical protein